MEWADYAALCEPPSADVWECGADGDYTDFAIASTRARALAVVIQRNILARLSHRDKKTDVRARISVTIEDLPGAATAVDAREAIDALRALIYAGDGCVGHRDCMEPWERARALLERVDDAPASAEVAEAAP